MSGARSMPGIEPLSRAAWLRIESRVFETLDRRERSGQYPAIRPRAPRRPLRAWAGALALAASASLLWFGLGRGSGSGELPSSGALASSAASVEALAARDGSRVVTSSGPVEVAVGDSVLTIGAQSVVQVNGDDHSGWLIGLQRGQVGCRVAPRGHRPPFVVRAGDTTVTVVGTRFDVTRVGEQARVSVQEGIVRVERAGHEVRLHAGDSWPPASDAGSSVAVAPPEAAAPPASESPASSESSDAGRGAEELARDESAPAMADDVRNSPRARGRSTQSSQGLFERAERLEARDPRAALEMYRRVGARGPWAAIALYGRARLELDLGDVSRARRDLERYLRRYPQGANVADVRALLERAQHLEPR